MKGALIFASLFAALAVAAPVEDKCACNYDCPFEGDELCLCAGKAALQCLDQQKAAGLSCSEPRVPEFCKAFMADGPMINPPESDVETLTKRDEEHVEIADIMPPVIAISDVESLDARDDQPHPVEIAEIDYDAVEQPVEYFNRLDAREEKPVEIADDEINYDQVEQPKVEYFNQ